MRHMANVLRTMIRYLAVGTLAAITLPATSQILVHASDFIANDTRTAFNGFEAYSVDLSTDRTHTEDGIKVGHVGAFRDIWTVMNVHRKGFEGQRSWYSQAADNNNPSNNGYTSIVLTSGKSFGSIGMLVGSGFGGYCNNDCDAVAPYLNLFYELFDHGVSVHSGVLAHQPDAHYIGFSGGRFDEVRLWDRAVTGWPGQSALMLDSIEVTAVVPEPAAPFLMLTGLGLLAGAHRLRRR